VALCADHFSPSWKRVGSARLMRYGDALGRLLRAP
jgi:hypothetical protein